ncbi:19536_t:CDS:2 [Dentiscutata erythropus]|uniref:19536_t:CDS:1 n=1 Tax=Dentiscutata erythropus TaxID=1348616 RepID=A0A9N9N9R3_9GLOM|nr:19536_t:CDS:2 [Dentiscutata erythropus]
MKTGIGGISLKPKRVELGLKNSETQKSRVGFEEPETQRIKVRIGDMNSEIQKIEVGLRTPKPEEVKLEFEKP